MSQGSALDTWDLEAVDVGLAAMSRRTPGLRDAGWWGRVDELLDRRLVLLRGLR